MKHWLLVMLIFISAFAHADSPQSIRARIEWVTTEFEQGRITEAQALHESDIISERIAKLEAQSAVKPIGSQRETFAQKVPEYTGNALLRQAAIPSVTAPLYESSGSVSRWSFARVFPYVFWIGALLSLGILGWIFGYGAFIARVNQYRQNTATVAGVNSVDRGPTLAASIARNAPHAAPRQRPVQTQQNAQPLRRSRRDTPYHSGEIPI
jgi:hypothetical protein